MSSPLRERLLVAQINNRLQPALVMGNVSNGQYSGNISKKGDKVSIAEIGNFTLTDHDGDTDITLSVNTPKLLQMEIDSSKYFNEVIDYDTVGDQMSQYMSALGQFGAYRIAEAVNYKIVEQYEDAGIKNSTDMGTPAAAIAAGTDISPVLRNLNRYMTEAGVPFNGRFAAVSPLVAMWIQTKYQSLLVNSDPMVRNGVIGNLETFDIVVDPAIQAFITANSGTFTDATGMIIAGVRGQSFAYAQALRNIEFYKPEKRFGQAVKGQILYGAKCFRPDMTAAAFVKAS